MLAITELLRPCGLLVQLHIEDVLDFLLLDFETVPIGSLGDKAEDAPEKIVQLRMHHKFAMKPEKERNRSMACG